MELSALFTLLLKHHGFDAELREIENTHGEQTIFLVQRIEVEQVRVEPPAFPNKGETRAVRAVLALGYRIGHARTNIRCLDVPDILSHAFVLAVGADGCVHRHISAVDRNAYGSDIGDRRACFSGGLKETEQLDFLLIF